jgi:hypothetical protein
VTTAGLAVDLATDKVQCLAGVAGVARKSAAELRTKHDAALVEAEAAERQEAAAKLAVAAAVAHENLSTPKGTGPTVLALVHEMAAAETHARFATMFAVQRRGQVADVKGMLEVAEISAAVADDEVDSVLLFPSSTYHPLFNIAVNYYHNLLENRL